MSTIKSVFLISPLSITPSFCASNTLLPSQFHLVEADDGSLNLYPLDGGKPEIHHIPAHNIACITYYLPDNNTVLSEETLNAELISDADINVGRPTEPTTQPLSPAKSKRKYTKKNV